MAQANTLDELKRKYKATTKKREAQEYEESTEKRYRAEQTVERISKAPSESKISKENLDTEIARIQIQLTRMAKNYGTLFNGFDDLLKGEGVMGRWDTIKYQIYEKIGMEKKADQLLTKNVIKQKESLNTLTEKIAEAINESHQKAEKGKGLAQTLLETELIPHMKYLNRDLVEELRTGITTDEDYEVAMNEVEKLDKELAEIDNVLAKYEKKVFAAKRKKDFENIRKFTNEMDQVLNIKEQILDGKLGAEGVVSEIRREILESSEAVQSAKGAIAMSWVNYRAFTAIVDSFSEMEFKYRHLRDHMVPVFKQQSQAAVMGNQILEMGKQIEEISSAYNALGEYVVNLTNHMLDQTFEIVKKPIFEVSKANDLFTTIDQIYAAKNKEKLAWADLQQRLDTLPEVVKKAGKVENSSGVRYRSHREAN